MSKIEIDLDCMQTSLYDEIQGMNIKLDNLLNPDFFTKIITDSMDKVLDLKEQEHKLFLTK